MHKLLWEEDEKSQVEINILCFPAAHDDGGQWVFNEGFAKFKMFFLHSSPSAEAEAYNNFPK